MSRNLVHKTFETVWDKAVGDLQVWLFGDNSQKGLVYTVDEGDLTNPEGTVKPFPDRPHLRYLATLWTHPEADLVCVPKSRQMLLTWFGMASIAWEAYQPGRRLGVMCRKFDPADDLLERVEGIMDRIPVPQEFRPRHHRKTGRLVVQHPDGPDTTILAMAQDSDATRSKTFSRIWVDEAAFTEMLEDVLSAAKPTVQSGGRMWLVSSPNGRNAFWRVASDSGRVNIEELINPSEAGSGKAS